MKQQGEDILTLKHDLTGATKSITNVAGNQNQIKGKLSAFSEKERKHYELVCSIRQREAKGNFILSGEHIPAYIQNINLYNI